VFLPPPPSKDATPRTILSWCSALLRSLSRRSRPRSLDRGHLSWGFIAPTALEEKRVHVRPRLPGTDLLGVTQAVRRRIPLRQLRCRSQVFPTSQRLSSSLHRPAIFRQVALMGLCPSGVCSSTAAPTTRRRRHTLVTFLPRFARVPVLGGDNLGRTFRIPRFTGIRAFGRLQGLRPQHSRSASSTPIKVSTTDLSPLGLPPPHGLTTADRPSFRRR